MKKQRLLVLFIAILFAFPLVSSAATLTQNQINSIILVLQVFGVSQQTIDTVSAELSGPTITTQVTPTTIATTTDTTIPQQTQPTFGTITQTTQTPMQEQAPQLTCTLTTPSNVGAPSSFVNLTWTSNADSAQIKNSRVYDQFTPLGDGKHPVSGATQAWQLSSEKGELNIFTIRFFGLGTSTDCSVSVLTQ